jgi:hypothetical protein
MNMVPFSTVKYSNHQCSDSLLPLSSFMPLSVFDRLTLFPKSLCAWYSVAGAPYLNQLLI